MIRFIVYGKWVMFVSQAHFTELHANNLLYLRYCIACEEDRPIQGFAEEFFMDIDKIMGEIPVLVIFTKYDKLIGQHQLILGEQNQDWPYAKTKQLAEGMASNEFEKKYLSQVMSKVKNAKRKPDWERVGRLQGRKRGGAAIGIFFVKSTLINFTNGVLGDPREETRTNDLITKTCACLAYSLRPMWVRTQRQNAKEKNQG